MADSNEQKVQDALAFAESIIDTIRDPLVVLNADLRVISASRAFYRTFGVTPAETQGQLIYQLGNGQWDIPRLRTLLEEILPQNTTFRDFEVEHVFEHVGRKIMLLHARKLYREQNRTERIVLVVEDVTERRDAEKARQEAETRFTEMVKNVRDHSIFLTDPQGIITSWNVAAERVMGYTEAEALGKHFSLIFVAEDLQHGVPEWELRTARETGRAEDERWHLRKDGVRFWALGIVTPLHDADGRLSGFSKVLRDITDRKRMEEELREARDHLEAQVQQRTASLEAEVARRATAEQHLMQRTEQLRNLMGEIVLTEQRERQRVAKILHDHLQQSLVAAEIRIGSLMDRGIEEIEEDASRIEELLAECLTTSRTLTAELSPPVLQSGGLVAALEWLVQSMADRHGLAIQFEKVEDVPEVPEELKILLFESVRELLFNVVKHSGTMRAKVEVRIEMDEKICVMVSDEGRGFDPAKLKSPGHEGGYGFIGIQERLERMGGSLDLSSAPGCGSRIALLAHVHPFSRN